MVGWRSRGSMRRRMALRGGEEDMMGGTRMGGLGNEVSGGSGWT